MKLLESRASDGGLLDLGYVVVAWDSRDPRAEHALAFPATCLVCGAPANRERVLRKVGTVWGAVHADATEYHWGLAYRVDLAGACYCPVHAPCERVIVKRWPGVLSIDLCGSLGDGPGAVRDAAAGARLTQGMLVDERLRLRFDRYGFAHRFAELNADRVAAPLADAAATATVGDPASLEALELLAAVQDERAVAPYLQLICGGPGGGPAAWPEVKQYARAFSRYGAGALDELVARMDAGGPGVRERCVAAIGELEDPRAVGVLSALLRDGGACHERRWAANGLARHRESAGVPEALERAAASDPDAHVRRWARRALKGRRY